MGCACPTFPCLLELLCCFKEEESASSVIERSKGEWRSWNADRAGACHVTVSVDGACQHHLTFVFCHLPKQTTIGRPLYVTLASPARKQPLGKKVVRAHLSITACRAHLLLGFLMNSSRHPLPDSWPLISPKSI